MSRPPPLDRVFRRGPPRDLGDLVVWAIVSTIELLLACVARPARWALRLGRPAPSPRLVITPEQHQILARAEAARLLRARLVH